MSVTSVELDILIQKGIELRGTELGSPKFKIWANDVRAAVKPYGDSMLDIIEGALSIGAVSWGELSAAAIRGGWAGSRSSRGSSRLQPTLSRRLSANRRV